MMALLNLTGRRIEKFCVAPAATSPIRVQGLFGGASVPLGYRTERRAGAV